MANDLPSLGRVEVAVGGGADLGAGQLVLRDHEVRSHTKCFKIKLRDSLQVVDVIQRDTGTGYTTVRKINTEEYGFVPSSSLILSP